MRRWLALVAVVALCGAGCLLGQKIEWRLPSFLNPSSTASDSATASRSIALKSGLAFTVRPSTLGISGSVDQLLGNDTRAVEVRVLKADPENALTLAWKGDAASGTLALGAYAGAHAMLLPAFWQTGAATAEANGGLWLSRAAYDDLSAKGQTEWRLGLADGTLAGLSAAFKTFNGLSSQIFGSATAVAELTPFTIKKTGVNDAYPLTVDGRIVPVRAILASSWFADFLILDNPDDPLILNVAVNPAAAPALKALEPAEVRWDELGYEITSLTRP